MACFWMACRLRMIFTFSKGCKKAKTPKNMRHRLVCLQNQLYLPSGPLQERFASLRSSSLESFSGLFPHLCFHFFTRPFLHYPVLCHWLLQRLCFCPYSSRFFVMFFMSSFNSCLFISASPLFAAFVQIHRTFYFLHSWNVCLLSSSACSSVLSHFLTQFRFMSWSLQDVLWSKYSLFKHTGTW